MEHRCVKSADMHSNSKASKNVNRANASLQVLMSRMLQAIPSGFVSAGVVQLGEGLFPRLRLVGEGCRGGRATYQIVPAVARPDVHYWR